MAASIPKIKIERFRALAAEGARVIDIAREVGVDRGTVSRYLTGDLVNESVVKAPAATLSERDVAMLRSLVNEVMMFRCLQCKTVVLHLRSAWTVRCVACAAVLEGFTGRGL